MKNIFLVSFLLICLSSSIISQDISALLPDSTFHKYQLLDSDTAKISFLYDFVMNNGQRNPTSCESLIRLAERLSKFNDNYKAEYINHAFASVFFRISKTDSIIARAEKVLILSDSIRQPKLFGSALIILSNTMRQTSKDVKAAGYRERARQRFLMAKDTTILAIISNDLGLYHFGEGNLSIALDYYYKALDGLTQMNHELGQAIVYNNIGMIIHQQKDIVEARANYKKALSAGLKVDAQDVIAASYNNIGSSFQDQGVLDSALYYHEQSLKIRELTKDYGRMGSCYNNFGIIAFQKGDYNEAILNYKKALRYSELAQDRETKSDILVQMGKAYQALLDYGNATKYLNQGLALANETALLNIQAQGHTSLYEVYKERQPSKALYHLEQSVVVKDSLLNEEKIRELTAQQKEFEFQKEKFAREQEIELLNTKNQLQELRLGRSKRNQIFSIIGLLGLSLFSLILFKNRNNIRKLNIGLVEKRIQLEVALKQKETLLKEIHHRVKNNLQVISSLLKLQSRSIDDKMTQNVLMAGQNRVRSMALIHQKLYQDDRLTGINMNEYFKELGAELIDNYNVSAQPIHFNLIVDEIYLDVDSVVPIGLIVNELITNSLKYAFEKQLDPQIDLHFTHKEDYVQLNYADNSSGFDIETIPNRSLGMRLIRSFANRLKSSLDWDTQNGTKVIMKIRDFELA